MLVTSIKYVLPFHFLILYLTTDFSIIVTTFIPLIIFPTITAIAVHFLMLTTTITAIAILGA